MYPNPVEQSAGIFWNIGLIRWSGSIYEPDKDFDCIEQESYGGDETVTQLETEINGEKQMISVDVLPLTYDAESIEEAFDKGFAYIDSVYLGTNENADHITEDLELIDSVDELGLGFHGRLKMKAILLITEARSLIIGWMNRFL